MGSGIEVLLISSRETKRWVVPKGWPIAGLKPWESASREAFEEAGVAGQTARKAIGGYDYDKRLKNGTAKPTHVEVFALEVMVQHPDWPEKGQRTLMWTPRDEAARLVHEAKLAQIIRQLK